MTDFGAKSNPETEIDEKTIDCQIRDLGDVTGKTLLVVPNKRLTEEGLEKMGKQWKRALPDSCIIVVQKGLIESIAVMDGIPENVLIDGGKS